MVRITVRTVRGRYSTRTVLRNGAPAWYRNGCIVRYRTVPYRTGVHGLAGEHYEAGTRTGTVLYCIVLYFSFFVSLCVSDLSNVTKYCTSVGTVRGPLRVTSRTVL